MRKKTLDEFIEKANTKFNFKDTIERDSRKRGRCIENGVKLYYFTFEKQYIKDFSQLPTS